MLAPFKRWKKKLALWQWKSSIWTTSWEKLLTMEDDKKINLVPQSCSLKYLCHQSNTSLKAVTFPNHLVEITTWNHKYISHDHHSQRPMFLLTQSSWMICVSLLEKLQQSKTKISVNLIQSNHIRGKVCKIFFLIFFGSTYGNVNSSTKFHHLLNQISYNNYWLYFSKNY